MNDVKDAFDRVLELPAPPPTSRAEMLVVAHAAAARRRTRRWTAGAAAVAAVSLLTVAAPRWLPTHDRGADRMVATPPDSSSREPQPSPVPATVTHEAHAAAMLETLLTVIPSRYSTPSEPIFTDSHGQRYRLQGTQIVSFKLPAGEINASTAVWSGSRAASASVHLAITGKPEPVGNLCVTGAIVHQGTQSGCRVLTAANGDRIRFAWRDVPRYGRIEYATRFHDGGSVTVMQSPGSMKPGTTNLGRIWSAQEMADAATTPAFWASDLAPFTTRVPAPRDSSRRPGVAGSARTP